MTLRSDSETRPASAFAADSIIEKFTLPAAESRIPLKNPGYTRAIFISLLKSLLPVATIFAPPFIASAGNISGSGTERANTIGSLAIELTISEVNIPPLDNPINTSAFFMASFKSPFLSSGFVFLEIASFAQFIPVSLLLWMMPLVSHSVISLIPALNNIFAVAMPAAPAPHITIFNLESSF